MVFSECFEENWLFCNMDYAALHFIPKGIIDGLSIYNIGCQNFPWPFKKFDDKMQESLASSGRPWWYELLLISFITAIFLNQKYIVHVKGTL